MTQELTFFGMESSISEYVKMVIEDRAESAGIDLKIKEVKDPDEFITHSLSSLPSIKMGSEIRSMNEKDPVMFARETSQWILEQSSYGSLTQIIVPIDFSAASENALEYALKLSENHKAYITILHVNRPETVDHSLDEVNPDISALKKEMLNTVLEKLNSQFSYTESSNKPLIRSEFKTGFAAEVILQLASEKEGSLIVMGTSGSSGNLKKYLGSVSTKVAQRSMSPVILVPPASQKRKIEQLVYCATDEKLDVSVMNELLTIAQATKAKLHVLHFVKRNDNYDQVAFLNILKNNYPKDKIKYHQIDGNITSEAINNYAADNALDLIVLSTKNRTYLDKLFHKSMTYEMSFMTQYPLLILRKN